jgi:uncharacterized protein YcbK (DUF882 family)
MDFAYFSERELACTCCGQQRMQEAFMQRLLGLRLAFAQAMPLASAYRCPRHNQAVSTTGDSGPHTLGRAVDVRVYGPAALRLIPLALTHGFTGIGVAQRGPQASRYLHLDDLGNAGNQPRPWVWSY